jgi:hypothetical protein
MSQPRFEPNTSRALRLEQPVRCRILLMSACLQVGTKSCARGTPFVSSDERGALDASRLATTSEWRRPSPITQVFFQAPSVLQDIDICAAKQCEPVQCGQHQLILNHTSINEMLVITKDNDDDTGMTTFRMIIMFYDALATSQTWKRVIKIQSAHFAPEYKKHYSSQRSLLMI